MIDKDRLIQLIANAPVMDEEKIGWTKLAEFMNEDELNKLMEVLQKEQDDLEELRAKYTARVEEAVLEESV
ncbi:hypothetical protein HN358_00185 [Candidatus Uhrbacteria bacterium]|jgi:hypothetical protein|nr:hypothetical protein [Candidatus Uhrbacteria bacterium]MBT7717267.1 hypothetical protein [Candidatus Uhrbacteria bacterium]